jgi:hypothetical protein
MASAVQGDPAQAVAWLANTLGAHGVTLDAGDVILSGSLVPLEPAQKGDVFRNDAARHWYAAPHGLIKELQWHGLRQRSSARAISAPI